MGCNSSSVVPLGESDFEDDKIIKVCVDPSTPDQKNSGKNKFFIRRVSPAALESAEPPEEFLTRDFNLEQKVPPPPPISFEIPIHDNENGESIIKKHPPKRLKRLEDNQMDSKDLTHEWIDERQMEAEARRNEILRMRMRSANHGSQKRNRRLVHSDAFNQESEEGDAEEII